MNKMKKVVGVVIAMALMISSFAVTNVTTVQAAVKLNKKTVTLYAGNTVQLKLTGVNVNLPAIVLWRFKVILRCRERGPSCRY